MDSIHTHNVNAQDISIPRDAYTFAVSFAGYDREKGKDDLVYIAVNSYWEDVSITLPDLHKRGFWYLSVNTYGDGQGRYFYPQGQEIRITGNFIMRPRFCSLFYRKTLLKLYFITALNIPHSHDSISVTRQKVPDFRTNENRELFYFVIFTRFQTLLLLFQCSDLSYIFP